MKSFILVTMLAAAAFFSGCVDGVPNDDGDAAVCVECPECPEPPECPIECEQLAREMSEAIKLLRILQYEPEPWRVTSLIELAHDYDECVLDHQ